MSNRCGVLQVVTDLGWNGVWEHNDGMFNSSFSQTVLGKTRTADLRQQRRTMVWCYAYAEIRCSYFL